MKRSMGKVRLGVLALLAGCGGAALIWAGVASWQQPGGEVEPSSDEPIVAAPVQPEAPREAPATEARKPLPTRQAAQRSLDFLTRETLAWQEQHKCFGCHVQGVTGEALAVGHANQYELPEGGLEGVFEGVLTLNGALRTEEGHSAQGAHLRLPSRGFGAAALARYDQLVSDRHSDDLLTVAQELLGHQKEGGEVSSNYLNGDVAQGTLQATYQAIGAWQQAYERSADPRWRAAVQKAEDYLRGQARGLLQQPVERMEVQGLNYTLLGLLAAGAGEREDDVAALEARLRQAQREDGGWGQQVAGDGESRPFHTGQTLYTLRRLGVSEQDAAVYRGIGYLVEKQLQSGGWSDGGAAKAEAMWAVLGLVATDVVSLDVEGITHGQHIEGVIDLEARAQSNHGGAVRTIKLAIDDQEVLARDGATLRHRWDTRSLPAGPHLVDLIATNEAGQSTRRRLTVYAGDHFLVGAGSRFQQGSTEITVRDIAPSDRAHQLELLVHPAPATADEPRPAAIYRAQRKGAQGAHTFRWSGQRSDGGEVKPGAEMIAVLRWVAPGGEVRHQVELPFVHDTLEAQRQRYGQLAGNIRMKEGEEAANAVVELVDEEGRVVDQVRSTNEGKWRFRNVKKRPGLKVRFRKEGYAPREEAAPAAAAEAGEEVKMDVQF